MSDQQYQFIQSNGLCRVVISGVFSEFANKELAIKYIESTGLELHQFEYVSAYHLKA